jgi:cysteinyl-tRNA synthetase
MNDDLNTSNALASLFEFVRDTNIAMDEGDFGPEDRDAALDVLSKIDSVFGVLGQDSEELLEPEIQARIDARNAARRSRDFKLADQIRNELVERGIILEDTPQGTKWKKK